MNGLLRVPLFDDEILSSYLSRLARANGNVAFKFCSDLGLNYHLATRGDPGEMAKLSELCGQSASTLSRHGVMFGEGHRVTILGETFGKRAVAKHRVRFCPDCFEQDEDDRTRMPHTRRYLRGVWLLRAIETCAVHSRSFVALEPQKEKGSRYVDFCELLELRAGEIREKSASARRRTPTELETFAHDRLNGIREHGDLLDGIALNVAIDISRMLGVALDHGKHQLITKLSPQQQADAARTGFHCLRQGTPAFDAALDNLSYDGAIPARGVYPAYGKLYTLIFQHRSGSEYDIVRSWIREHAEKNLPAKTAPRLLVADQAEKWTTVGTIARGLGISKAAVLHRLADADVHVGTHGVVEGAAAGLFGRFRGVRLSGKKAAAILGCPTEIFFQLVTGGLIKRLDLDDAAVSKKSAKRQTKLFSAEEIEAFRRGLFDRAKGSADKRLLSVRQIARKHSMPQATVITQIFEGRLETVACLETGCGILDDLVVDSDEFTRSADSSGLVSAGEACRLLDIRAASLTRLLALGVFEFSEEQNRPQRFARRMIDRSEIDAFRERYVTIAQLVRSTGLDRGTVHSRIKAEGIRPAFPPAKYGAFYMERTEVEKLLPDMAPAPIGLPGPDFAVAAKAS
ncbi:TniQ family protein [Pararhizobium qamdonense]|uniref:TniQ family protein n=1 Tax=Pararhizobium qamdonense TaxID=3031126 RepID=UPI0023E27977|nr:TniQ family protein [Pararhizobium qamdonense]